MDAVRRVEEEVRELIRRRGLDPSEQAPEILRLVEAAVNDYDERAVLGSLPPLGHLETARKHVYDALAGFGVLQPFLDDPTVKAARARGRVGGRRPVIDAAKGRMVKAPYEGGQYKVHEIAERVGVSRASVYNFLKAERISSGMQSR